jgi:hypothetical protein
MAGASASTAVLPNIRGSTVDRQVSLGAKHVLQLLRQQLNFTDGSVKP